MEIIGLKAPGNYSGKIVRFAYGRTKKPPFLWFQDFWRLPWLPKPIMLISGETTGCQFWDRRDPENDEDPFKNFLKTLNMTSICIKKHEVDFFVNFWNQETRKPKNQETNKPRNQETKKRRNQETKNLLNIPTPTFVFDHPHGETRAKIEEMWSGIGPQWAL